MTAAIGRARSNARTRKTRARAALAKLAEWTALTKEEQNSRVHSVELDLKLQNEMHQLDASWNEKIGRDTDEEEVVEDSDDGSDSGKDMEDGPVDADADEPLFDAHGNPIVKTEASPHLAFVRRTHNESGRRTTRPLTALTYRAAAMTDVFRFGSIGVFR